MKILNLLLVVLIATGAFIAGMYSPFNKTADNEAIRKHELEYHSNATQPPADIEERLVQEEQIPNDTIASSETSASNITAPIASPTQAKETPKAATVKNTDDSNLELKSDYWGGGNPADVMKVLSSAKRILDEAFQSDAKNKVWVYQNIPRGYPITLYEKGPNGEYKIELTSTQRYWSNYAYQFSHEYCHVRTNYENPNPKSMWFEEVIGEMCSLYALRGMGEEWLVNPPYENWRSYGSSLKQYADDIIRRPENQLPAGQDFAIWFANTLPELEQNAQLRGKNSVIAQQLLPLFAANPELWDSLNYWNQWQHDKNDDIWRSFSKWLQVVPAEYQKHVNLLINKLR